MTKRQLAEFKNVGLLKETHDKLRRIAEHEQRTFTRQLKMIIDREYDTWNFEQDPYRVCP